MAGSRILPFRNEGGFFHKRATKSMDKQDFISALRHLRRAIAVEPDTLEFRMDLADIYARMGCFERSNLELLLCFHRPDLPHEALFGIGCNYMMLGDYEQARIMLTSYLEAEPEGEFEEQCLQALAQIVEGDDEDELDRKIDELSFRGKAALDAGELTKAVRCFERALEQDVSMTYVRNNLALAYFCMGDMTRAWAQVKTILKEAPMDVHGRCNAALFYFHENKKEKAKKSVLHVRLEQIDDPDDLYKYCVTLAEMDLHSHLEQALRKMNLYSAYDPTILYLMGACQYNLGRYGEAQRTFEKLLACEPYSMIGIYGNRFAGRKLAKESALESLTYGIEPPQEVGEEIDAQLREIIDLNAQDAKERIKEDYVQAVLRAALSSQEQQHVGKAMAVLTTLQGPVAEQIFREILLSPTHTDFAKGVVCEALRNIDAPIPYFMLSEGKVMRVESTPLIDNMSAKHLPPAYADLIMDAMHNMTERYHSAESASFVLQCWSNYIASLEAKGYPKITSPKAWVAALEAQYLLYAQIEFDEEALAKEAETTVRTLRLRMKKLQEADTHVEE